MPRAPSAMTEATSSARSTKREANERALVGLVGHARLAGVRALVVGVVVLSVARGASADPERIHLQFEVDERCPSEEAFVREILSRTHDVHFVSEDPARLL